MAITMYKILSVYSCPEQIVIWKADANILDFITES